MTAGRAESRVKLAATSPRPTHGWNVGFPLAGGMVLGACLAAPSIYVNSNLLAAFGGASALLIGWAILLVISNRVDGGSQRIEVVLRPQDSVAALAQIAILACWGVYWSPLRDAALLIAAQAVFAYGLDMLVVWSRRERYTLGFGLLAMVCTINLFLRFQDDWFSLQFTVVAVAVLARELIQWNRDGQRAPVFNPAALVLALAAAVLIATDRSDLAWGDSPASGLFQVPRIYLLIVAASLPGLYLFRMAPAVLPAVLATYGFSLVYLRLTGSYFFVDATIPVAAFLGMHVLLADPDASPRTDLGRIASGVLYAASVVGLHWLLRRFGVPTFHAVLLPMPVLNVLGRVLDWVARARIVRWVSPEAFAARLTPGVRSLGYLVLWVAAFGALSSARAVGDFHEARTVPFWYQACQDNRANGCRRYGDLLSTHCTSQSGWACNELAVLVSEGRFRSQTKIDELFEKACGYGSDEGCDNHKAFLAGRLTFGHAYPTLLDFRQVLRQGKPLRERTPFQIYSRACEEGWMAGCDGLAGIYFVGSGVPSDKARAAALELRACDAGEARACSNLGLMHHNGDGVPKDRAKALDYLSRACDLGMQRACTWLDEESSKPAA